jgi:phage tail-like protein
MATQFPPIGYYPPVGFHFKVVVGDFSANNEMRFSEVSGLSTEIATEEVIEGGENRFVQKYPIRAKYPDLVLKRGLLVGGAVQAWIYQCIEENTVTPKDILVTLLNEQHEPLMVWNLVKAYPTKWAVSDLNASSNTVAIETITFYYQYFTLTKS